MESIKKRVYCFGGKTAEGNGTMRELLGGKGANLAAFYITNFANQHLQRQIHAKIHHPRNNDKHGIHNRPPVVEYTQNQVMNAIANDHQKTLPYQLCPHCNAYKIQIRQNLCTTIQNSQLRLCEYFVQNLYPDYNI